MERVKDQFTPRMFRRLLIPSLASSLGLALADMADAVVVGQSMGATGLAAISLSLPLYMVFNVFMHGLGIGGSVSYSQLLGEGRAEDAVSCFNRVMRAGLLISLAIAAVVNLFPDQVLALLGTEPADGALFSASKGYVRIIALGAPLFFFSYMMGYFLRSDDNQRLASVGFLLGNGTDILCNIIFVLWLDGGTVGAALATLAGLVVSAVCYLPALFGRGQILRPALPAPDAKQVLNCFRTGFATSSQYIFQMIFLLIANNVLMHRAGESGVAVFDMIQNASYLVLYLYDGTAKAAQPLVSTFHGEKNDAAAHRTLRLSLFWGLVAGGVAAVLIFLFPGFVCQVFGLHGEELIRMGSFGLRMFGLSTPFAGISILLESCFQGMEEERSAFIIALLRGCLVLLPCTMLFSLFPLKVFWWIYPVNEFVSLLLFLLWRRVRRPQTDFDRDRVLSLALRETQDVAGMNDSIEEFCQKWEAAPRQQFFVTMAAEEICMAIFNKAMTRVERGEVQVTLVALEDGQFELHVRDNAAKFDPFSLHTSRVGEEGDFDMDAMGMLVIKKQAKDFFYREYQGFNTLVVRI